MIKSFIKRLLGQPVGAKATPLGKRVEFGPQEHGIDPALLDDNAVRVVRTLSEAGHEAYIVGGAVRDLLVGRRPKDFDVATSATPEQVKALFRRAFIIGRRFRIVHVVFGRGREHEVIEVSTFRALLGAEAAEQVSGNERTAKAAMVGKSHVVDESGRVLRDNVWGPQIEDAARRDFTINAMYYQPLTQTVVDYHGGLKDLRGKTLRIIGDAAARYREDPVRIVRVARFAAKLGFGIEKKTALPIAELAPLLLNVPASRLFDEMVKLLQTGHAVASLKTLERIRLPKGVFPVLDALGAAAPDSAARQAFVTLALEDTDRRVAEGRSVAPSFLLACLLWHDVTQRSAVLQAQGQSPQAALADAIDAVFDAKVGDISGRGKLAADMREIWMMQPRFERRSPSAAVALVEQARFRAGYDFLRLRADAGEGEGLGELAEWWEDFSLGSDEDREAMLEVLRKTRTKRVPGPAKRAGAEAAEGSRSKPRAASGGSAGSGGSTRDAAGEGGSPSAGSAATAPAAVAAPSRPTRHAFYDSPPAVEPAAGEGEAKSASAAASRRRKAAPETDRREGEPTEAAVEDAAPRRAPAGRTRHADAGSPAVGAGAPAPAPAAGARPASSEGDADDDRDDRTHDAPEAADAQDGDPAAAPARKRRRRRRRPNGSTEAAASSPADAD